VVPTAGVGDEEKRKLFFATGIETRSLGCRPMAWSQHTDYATLDAKGLHRKGQNTGFIFRSVAQSYLVSFNKEIGFFIGIRRQFSVLSWCCIVFQASLVPLKPSHWLHQAADNVATEYNAFDCLLYHKLHSFENAVSTTMILRGPLFVNSL
jgi:hypothetical protein